MQQRMSPDQADQIGELAARPLSERAAPAIREALASKPAGGQGTSRRRSGSSPRRGGAATGSVAAPPRLDGAQS